MSHVFAAYLEKQSTHKDFIISKWQSESFKLCYGLIILLSQSSCPCVSKYTVNKPKEKLMDVWRVVPVTVDWYGSSVKFGKMWRKRLLRESEYLFKYTGYFNYTLFQSLWYWNGNVLVLQTKNQFRKINMLCKASHKVWIWICLFWLKKAWDLSALPWCDQRVKRGERKKAFWVEGSKQAQAWSKRVSKSGGKKR